MRKTVLIVLTMIAIGASSLTAVDLGIGLTYGMEIEEAGLHIDALLEISRELRIGPDFTYYFTDEELTVWEINLNLQYCFVSSGDLKVYALGGIQFAHSSLDTGGISSSDNEIGFNAGIGLEYRIDKFKFFLEPRYTFSGLEQFSVCAGGRFRL